MRRGLKRQDDVRQRGLANGDEAVKAKSASLTGGTG